MQYIRTWCTLNTLFKSLRNCMILHIKNAHTKNVKKNESIFFPGIKKIQNIKYSVDIQICLTFALILP